MGGSDGMGDGGWGVRYLEVWHHQKESQFAPLELCRDMPEGDRDVEDCCAYREEAG